MNAVLARAVDDLATGAPDRCGYGYADSQSPWRHDPAIDQPREAFLQFLDHVAARRPAGAVVVTAGRRTALPPALLLVAARVVVVDTSLAGDGDGAGLDPDRVALVHGAADAPATAAAVRALLPRRDLLFVDGIDDAHGLHRALHNLVPLLGAGATVAVAERSQELAGLGADADADAGLAAWERDQLLPHGVRLQRFGGAAAIHCYRVPAAPPQPAAPPAPRATPALVASAGTCRCFAWQGRVLAVEGAGETLSPRRLLRNGYPLVLAAADAAAAGRLALAFAAAEPQLDRARAALAAGDAAAAAATVAAVVAAAPWLAAALRDSVPQAPHCRRLLLALGALELFGPQPPLGAALWRRALDGELCDGPLLQAMAQAYLLVVQDADAARRLLQDAQDRVRQRRVAELCHDQLRGHLLWHYPKLLAEVRTVLQVGAHRGALVPAFAALGFTAQCCIEPDPAAAAALAAAAQPFGAAVQVLPVALGAAPGRAVLHAAADGSGGSLLPHHPLAAVPPERLPLREVPVAVETLDGLRAAGRLPAAGFDLWLLDVEGSELEVLRGAVGCLPQARLLAVTVQLDPLYQGAPLPQQVQAFLREADPQFAWQLCAFEPGPRPGTGQALFRRYRKPRRAP